MSFRLFTDLSTIRILSQGLRYNQNRVPVDSKHPGDLYTTPVVLGVTKTLVAFTIYPTRSTASEDNSESCFPISEPLVVIGLASPAASHLFFCS